MTIKNNLAMNIRYEFLKKSQKTTMGEPPGRRFLDFGNALAPPRRRATQPSTLQNLQLIFRSDLLAVFPSDFRGFN